MIEEKQESVGERVESLKENVTRYIEKGRQHREEKQEWKRLISSAILDLVKLQVVNYVAPKEGG